MSYLDAIDAVTGLGRLKDRAAIVGDAMSPTPIALPVPAPSGKSFFDFRRSNASSADVSDGVQTLAGAALGGLFWPQHRILGIAGGASLGSNVPALFVAEKRRNAACNLAQTGGGIAAALLAGGGPGRRFVMFLLGVTVSGALLYYSGARGVETEVKVP